MSIQDEVRARRAARNTDPAKVPAVEEVTSAMGFAAVKVLLVNARNDHCGKQPAVHAGSTFIFPEHSSFNCASTTDRSERMVI